MRVTSDGIPVEVQVLLLLVAVNATNGLVMGSVVCVHES
jgi:hypothetical protein